MKKYFLIFLLTIASFNCKAQDFRNAYFGDTPEAVKKSETLPLLKDNYVQNKLESLSYVEFTDSAFYYTYYYMFYGNKLIGGRTKTAYLTQENSRYNILILYNQAKADYEGKYNTVKEEKVSNPEHKKFSVSLKNKKLFVELRDENNEYFLLESVLQQKQPAKKK